MGVIDAEILGHWEAWSCTTYVMTDGSKLVAVGTLKESR